MAAGRNLKRVRHVGRGPPLRLFETRVHTVAARRLLRNPLEPVDGDGGCRVRLRRLRVREVDERLLALRPQIESGVELDGSRRALRRLLRSALLRPRSRSSLLHGLARLTSSLRPAAGVVPAILAFKRDLIARAVERRLECGKGLLLYLFRREGVDDLCDSRHLLEQLRELCGRHEHPLAKPYTGYTHVVCALGVGRPTRGSRRGRSPDRDRDRDLGNRSDAMRRQPKLERVPVPPLTSPAMRTHEKLFIGGEWVAPAGDRTRST